MPHLDDPIEVTPGSLKDLGDFVKRVAPTHRYAVITDSHVGPLYGRAAHEALGIDPNDVLAIPAGENSKTRGSWGWITDQLIERGFGRDSAIVALGGGVQNLPQGMGYAWSGISLDSSRPLTCAGSRSFRFRRPCWR